jgi:hypothetical protein
MTALPKCLLSTASPRVTSTSNTGSDDFFFAVATLAPLPRRCDWESIGAGQAGISF